MFSMNPMKSGTISFIQLNSLYFYISYVNTSIDILIMGERKSLLKLIFTLTLFVTRKLYNRQSLEMKTKAGDAIG